ncbi:MAG TPA: hypothetical protein VME44_13850 [Streptosporangiaceae bacterium]|nr:hypothetical protein [Streptosporangiaceae bacterium]
MPAASPVPRGPSMLTLYGVADLLTAAGCPVCRYVTEASDRHLGWFALEGHSQPELIATLSASLGMCARHTRGLMNQPGAAIRLTPVYRYVLTGVRHRLAGGTLSLAPCPACRHDDAAAERVLDTLQDGLSDTAALRQCRDQGGVCLPHLEAAARHGTRRIVVSLAAITRDVLAARPAGYEWLAGADYDAEIRVRLRETIRASGSPVTGPCGACLAAAQAERESLAHVAGFTGRSLDGAGEGHALCAGHLADAVVMSGSGHRGPLLEWQFGHLAALGQSPADGVRARAAHWLRPPVRRNRSEDCPVCRDSGNAALQALSSACTAVRETPQDTRQLPALCLRHRVKLQDVDRRAARVLSRDSVAAADELIRELATAFEQTTWAGRRDAAPAPESTAWRRAAAFLDGGVFTGRCA